MDEKTAFEMYYAVRNGDAKKAIKMFNEGDADSCDEITPHGRSLLLHASLYGNEGIVPFLLDRGCSVDKSDEDGLTPLLAAVQNGHLDIAKMLLKSGADPNLSDKKGNTPLSSAIFHQSKNLALIELLVRSGADPTRENQFGQSPYALSKKFALEKVTEFFDQTDGHRDQNDS